MQINIDPPKLSDSRGPFDDLLQDLTKQLNEHPPEQRVPISPPSVEEYEEVVSKAKRLGINVVENPVESLVVGGEILRRSTLIIARVGLSKDRRVLSVLFQATKRTRAYVFYPSPKLDALDLGKMLFWGIAACISEDLVQSRIVEIPEFLKINACDLDRLLRMSDEQRAVEAARREASKTLAEESSLLRRCERARDELMDRLDLVSSELVSAQKVADEESSRALYWQLAALSLSGLLVIMAVAIMH
jgi:hypothetical protein